MVSVCSAWGPLPLLRQVLGSNAVETVVVVVVFTFSSLYVTLNLTYDLFYVPLILR